MKKEYEELFGNVTTETTTPELLERITSFKEAVLANDMEYDKLKNDYAKVKDENDKLTDYNRKLYNKIVTTTPTDEPEGEDDSEKITFDELAKLYGSNETKKRRL